MGLIFFKVINKKFRGRYNKYKFVNNRHPIAHVAPMARGPECVRLPPGTAPKPLCFQVHRQGQALPAAARVHARAERRRGRRRAAGEHQRALLQGRGHPVHGRAGARPALLEHRRVLRAGRQVRRRRGEGRRQGAGALRRGHLQVRHAGDRIPDAVQGDERRGGAHARVQAAAGVPQRGVPAPPGGAGRASERGAERSRAAGTGVVSGVVEIKRVFE